MHECADSKRHVSPMSAFHMAGLTDAGRVRPSNEDTIATNPEIGVAVLADGMGGHQAGEVASHLAVDVITRHLAEAASGGVRAAAGDRRSANAETVEAAIRLANGAIFEAAHARPECAGMGSTVVVALFRDDLLCIGHVGDSRVYRLRGGKLEQLTQDHSVIQELVNRGLFTAEEARQSVAKNLVTRALGVEATVTADLRELHIEPGDVYLLCSDGLNDMVSDAEIEGILLEHHANLEAAAGRLVTLANERGGPDNISVILVWPTSEAVAGKRPQSGDDGTEFRITRNNKFISDDQE